MVNSPGETPWRLPSGAEVETYIPPEIDTSVPHIARMYDYYLGGKDNFAADRAAAEQVLAVAPEARMSARANRAFLGRAVRFAAESGIRRFLDVGTGLPASGNTHEVAQAVAPDSRVAYVDNDPIVLAHARALIAGDPRGGTSFALADLREPEKILAAPEVREVLDPGLPVAVVLMAVLHFIRDEDDPAGLVRRLLDPLPSGSMLLLSHATGDVSRAPTYDQRPIQVYSRSTAPVTPRTHAQVATMFDGLDLLDPGVVLVPHWRPAEDDGGIDPAQWDQVFFYGGVAFKR